MEIWKPVAWYEWLYEVSNTWKIKSLSFRNNHCTIKREKILSWGNQNWYTLIYLCKSNKSNKFTIHRIVAQAFLENPENKEQVNHKNWIKNDNRLENLEWCTCSENGKHSYDVLWRKSWNEWKILSQAPKSKKIVQLSLDWEPIRYWDCMKEAILIYWTTIWDCCRWKTKTSKWFIWRFI